MKRSLKTMLLGIGIILVGIIGVMFNLEQSYGVFFQVIAFYVPIFSMFAGPIILLIGFFTKD